ncbi:pseudaminic acid synthase [Rheinheimera sp.]|uniref:pseudaminic acid synthase n=1 Tax=Rheinheimera sp. TaxID=1869214 RepID=UPI00307F8D7D
MDWIGDKTLIIAELSANHNNDLERAKATIHAMAAAGADAVKVQTYKPESLCMDIDNAYFGKRPAGLWKGRTLWDLYKEGSLPYEWHAELQQVAKDAGLLFFSSPFDLDAVDFLEQLAVPFYKIASFEINHIPLIDKVARTGKPVIISTGVADEADIQLALATCYQAGNRQVALLKCTSQYPAQIADANLKTIPAMLQRFSVPVGVSDHTAGALVPGVAVSLGARIVEKHFTLNRADGGPDSAFSMEPDEFKQMVEQVRQVEASLGQVSYQISHADKMRRRSIFFAKNLAAGEIIQPEDIRVLRNGSGLHPRYLNLLYKQELQQDAVAGEPTTTSHFDQSLRLTDSTVSPSNQNEPNH